jgi:hypothetical protein
VLNQRGISASRTATMRGRAEARRWRRSIRRWKTPACWLVGTVEALIDRAVDPQIKKQRTSRDC